MSGFVIAIQREHNLPPEIYGQAPTENSAITRADRLYNQMLLDTVAVVRVDSKTGIITTPYKRIRRCKHSNVQFTLSQTGIHPVCNGCGLVMEVEEDNNEEGRCNSTG